MWGHGSSVGRATFMKNGGQGFKPLPMPFPLFSDCIVTVFSYLFEPLNELPLIY